MLFLRRQNAHLTYVPIADLRCLLPFKDSCHGTTQAVRARHHPSLIQYDHGVIWAVRLSHPLPRLYPTQNQPVLSLLHRWIVYLCGVACSMRRARISRVSVYGGYPLLFAYFPFLTPVQHRYVPSVFVLMSFFCGSGVIGLHCCACSFGPFDSHDGTSETHRWCPIPRLVSSTVYFHPALPHYLICRPGPS